MVLLSLTLLVPEPALASAVFVPGPFCKSVFEIVFRFQTLGIDGAVDVASVLFTADAASVIAVGAGCAVAGP